MGAMKAYFLASLLAVAALGAAAASAAPSAGPAWLDSGPRLRDASGASTNWAGYAVTGPQGSVSDAKASWIVPAVSCAAGETSYSSFWVGIDGFASRTVEQTGSESDCRNGVATYFAWFEFYPKFPTNSRLAVHPGDRMSAEVSFAAKGFTLSIKDVTTGLSDSASGKVNGAARSSAEWIAEAPSSSGGVLPLANFGSGQFGLSYTSVASTSYATVSGHAGPIGSFGAAVSSIDMVTSGGALVKAQTSALSADGTSFTVQWKARGP
jgi:hypothetical protein